MNNSTEKLSIAVASSLRYVFEELAVDFKGRAPDIGVDLMFASSGKLTAQIENGAPFDIFISADHSYIEYIKAQLPIAEEPRVFAEGKMVLWSMSPLSGKLLEDLSRAERIAIANPDVAPFGRAAIEVLDRLAIDGEVRARIVEGENIGQVNQFITLEAAQVGFTSRSVVLAPGLPHAGHWYDVADSLYDPLEQSALSLAQDANLASQTFMNYLSSDAARKILQKYGYKISNR